MARQFATSLRNTWLDAHETALGTTPNMKFYTGAPPANVAAAATGTLVATVALPSDWAAAAASGSKAGSGLPWTIAAAATGKIGHYRFETSGGTVIEQGTVGENATAWAVSTAYTVGNRRAANGNVYRCTTAGTSASSGTGPSGTGTGITDGTAVWEYLCVQGGDITIDNCDVTATQNVSVTAYTNTAPGA